jgi:hypothetical protein
MASNSFSICIPRAVKHVSEDQVKSAFNEFFHTDCVERVDMVLRTDRNTSEEFWIVFVHFTDAARQSAASLSLEGLPDQQKFIDDISADKQTKIIYDKHWFWKCRRNNAKSKSETNSVGPRLMTDTDEVEFQEFQQRRAKILAETALYTTPDSEAQTLEEYLEEGHLKTGAVAAAPQVQCWAEQNEG